MKAVVPAIILCCAVCTWSQTTSGVLSGQILDTAGAVVAGAQVTLEINGKTVAKTISDVEGGYKFTEIPVGEYFLLVKTHMPRLFRKNVVLKTGESRRVDIEISFAPCSEDTAIGKDNGITVQDRIEIIRALVELSFGKKTYFFVPEGVDIRWLTPEQKAKMVIMSREQLQEITEKDGPLEYYSIAPLKQRGACVEATMVRNWTVKGQLDDANMAGGATIYEFRKVAGRWEGEIFKAIIS